MSNRYLRPPTPSRNYHGHDDAPREDLLRFAAWAREFYGVTPVETDETIVDKIMEPRTEPRVLRLFDLSREGSLVRGAIIRQVSHACTRSNFQLPDRIYTGCYFRAKLEECCGQARGAHGQVFDFEDAPMIPLAGCEVDRCNCKLFPYYPKFPPKL